MLLHEILEFAAVRAATEPALVFDDRTWTFGELHERVERSAGALGAVASPGDRVAVLSENTAAFVELYYATSRAGTPLTFLNYRLHPEEWASTLAHAEARVLVGQRALLDRAAPFLDRCPTLEVVFCTDDPGTDYPEYEAAVADAPPARTLDGQSPDDMTWLLYTSGTTGRPKGAMLTHTSLVTAATATAMARPLDVTSDVYLFPFPLCHVAGYNVLLFHLHARPVILMRRFEPGALLEAIERHGVTNVSLAPTMISTLLDHPGLDDADLSTLRSVGYGASGIPAEVLRRGLDRVRCDFEQGYGMTELSGNAAFLDGATHRRGAAGEEHLLRAAGRPGPLASIRVVDESMRDLPVGEAGEIVVRGDQVTKGYWRDPEATANAFAGGWFHTGDLGRFDEEGFLSVVDRKKDVIVTGGENVASREVEEVLYRHPGVREVAVVGVPDEHWGEAVCAVVVAREPGAVTGAELVELCRDHLAGFKKPRHVVFVDGLPKNHSGKILKRELRAMLEEDLEAPTRL